MKRAAKKDGINIVFSGAQSGYRDYATQVRLFKEKGDWRLVDECLREEEMLCAEEPPAIHSGLGRKRGEGSRSSW